MTFNLKSAIAMITLILLIIYAIYNIYFLIKEIKNIFVDVKNIFKNKRRKK